MTGRPPAGGIPSRPTPSVVIRAATLDDLEQVAGVERVVFGSDPFPAFFFRQAYDLWSELLRVAEPAPGELAGYVLGALSSRPGEAWILSAAVRAEHRGRGIARRLTGELLRVLAGIGVREVRLTVHPENRGAAALYLGLGFRTVAEEPAYFGPGEPRLLMCRELVREPMTSPGSPFPPADRSER